MSGATSQHRRPPPLAGAARAPIKDWEHVTDLGRFGMIDRWVATRKSRAGKTALRTVGELRHECARTAEGRQWFLRQCGLHAQLQHPNWQATEDFGEFRGRFFCVAEYLEGQSLAVLKRRDVLPLAEELYVLRQAIAGLAYLHGLDESHEVPAELAHGRFGLDAVFVGYDGSVKLRDMAEPAPGLPNQRPDVFYAPPETALGQRPDPRSDVFVAGVLLWEAMSRRSLWQGLPEATVLRRLELGVIPDLRCFNPNAPSDICRVVERALASAPDKRYEDARELRQALERCLADGMRPATQESLSSLVSESFARDRARMRDLVHHTRTTSGSGARPMPTAEPASHAAEGTTPRSRRSARVPRTSQSGVDDKRSRDTRSDSLRPERQIRTSGMVAKSSDKPTATHDRLPSTEQDGTEALFPHPYTPVTVLHRSEFGRVIAIRHAVSGSNLIGKIHTRDSGVMGRAVAAAALRHPHTARILDVGRTPDGAGTFTIHERVDGVALARMFAGGGTLAPSIAIPLVRQVVCSLMEAHARGIVHARLRPEHVFVSECPVNGRWATVIGYEGEKSTEAATAMSEWAAPELLAGGVPTPSSDLYAAGLILLKCVLGRTADSETASPAEIVRRLVDERHLAFRVPGLSEAIAAAIATDPDRRPKTAASWLGSLDAIAANAPTAQDHRTQRARRPSAQAHRFALEHKPSIWALHGDAGLSHESVRAALMKLGVGADIRVISADAEEETLSQLAREKLSPPWVVLFGREHVRRNNELLSHLSLVGEVSRVLITVHPTSEEIRQAVHATGLDAHIGMPSSTRDVIASIERMLERSREIRRRYDEIRYALRDTRSQLGGLSRSLATRPTLPPAPAGFFSDS